MNPHRVLPPILGTRRIIPCFRALQAAIEMLEWSARELPRVTNRSAEQTKKLPTRAIRREARSA
jgi:hypothetical protein